MNSSQVFVVANLTEVDADLYRRYREGLPPLMQRYEGSLLVSDDKAVMLEGSIELAECFVIIGFPSEEHAGRLFEDPEYQTLAGFRRRGTKTQFMCLVHGLANNSPTVR